MFCQLLQQQSDTLDKSVGYDPMDKLRGVVQEFIDAMLTKYKFINGNQQKNRKNPDAYFWWQVYGLSNSLNSIHLKTAGARHHATAWERNEALLADVRDILRMIPSGEAAFEGSSFKHLQSEEGLQIQLGCISPEAGELMDSIMEAYCKHYANGQAGSPPIQLKTPDEVYGAFYWLVRWSGLVQPNLNFKKQE